MVLGDARLTSGEGMPIKRSFSAAADISLLPEITNSLGAHLSAKLQEFASDERTLTDEFCDMTCIWASSASSSVLPPPSTGITVRLDIEKISSRREVHIGADLELTVFSPIGETKRILAQAKVLDPETLKLRCDSTHGWVKLKDELRRCRAQVGDLAYFLAYVPARELNGSRYTFGTWEQRHSTPSGAGLDSRFGVTFIDVNSLLDDNDEWKQDPPVQYVGRGSFRPSGLDWTSLLLQLFSCGIGSWQKQPPTDAPFNREVESEREPYRALNVAVTGIENTTWEERVVPYFREFIARFER